MTHGRHPRRARPINANAFGAALRKATRLTPQERAETMAAARQCEKRLREGVASEEHHTVLYTVLLLALGIEDAGIVRGLRGHFDAALAAMASIRARACPGNVWRPTALHYYELDAIREAVDLHEYQLRQVSAGELHAITKKLMARTLSTGGAVERRSLAELGIHPGATA